MTDLRTAAQQALEALWTAATPQAEEAITALRAALEVDDAAAELRRLHALNGELLVALKWIATVNAMDYEYQAKARVAIARTERKV